MSDNQAPTSTQRPVPAERAATVQPLPPFRYVKPSLPSIGHIQTVREACEALYDTILETVPNCRERSIAITNLEQVSMWANKAIAFTQVPPPDDAS